MHFSHQLIGEIVEVGACGYVLKSDADRELVAAVQTVANRGSYFTSKADNTLGAPHSMPASSAFEEADNATRARNSAAFGSGEV